MSISINIYINDLHLRIIDTNQYGVPTSVCLVLVWSSWVEIPKSAVYEPSD